MAAGDEIFGSGTTAKVTDTERVLESKILTALNGGGGGGSGNVKASAVDPTGVVSVSGPGICFGTGAVDGLVWKKTSAGTGTDWVQM